MLMLNNQLKMLKMLFQKKKDMLELQLQYMKMKLIQRLLLLLKKEINLILLVMISYQMMVMLICIRLNIMILKDMYIVNIQLMIRNLRIVFIMRMVFMIFIKIENLREENYMVVKHLLQIIILMKELILKIINCLRKLKRCI